VTDRSAGGWEPGEYERLAGIAVAAVARYVEESQAGETPVGSPPPLADLVEELELRTLVRRGGMDADRFEEWLGRMLARSVRLHHPAQVAHQVGAPDVPAAISDLVPGRDQPAHVHLRDGPGGARGGAGRRRVDGRELGLGRRGRRGAHARRLAGEPDRAARRACGGGPGRVDRRVDGCLAVLAPPSAHYSVKRSVAMLGLGERAVVDLEVDAEERIVPGALGGALERCRASGRRPMALVAAACATSTKLHDDLEAVGAFCREHGIWFHLRNDPAASPHCLCNSHASKRQRG
jgi:L-2,4-diaminobutyrate decarboxylase